MGRENKFFLAFHKNQEWKFETGNIFEFKERKIKSNRHSKLR
jgi:hypothetical protein